MPGMGSSNPSFLNGVPELLILQLLAERPMYGYQLVKTIQARSRDVFTFGEGCIYPILHHLDRTGLLISERREVSGRTRNYYQVTAKGHRRLTELTDSWTHVAAGVAAILGGQSA